MSSLETLGTTSWHRTGALGVYHYLVQKTCQEWTPTQMRGGASDPPMTWTKFVPRILADSSRDAPKFSFLFRKAKGSFPEMTENQIRMRVWRAVGWPRWLWRGWPSSWPTTCQLLSRNFSFSFPWVGFRNGCVWL